MAYWQFNAYSISFEDEIEAKEFYDKLINWYNLKSPQGVEWRRPWLGNVVIGAELGTWDFTTQKFDTDMFCAGCFSEEPELDVNIVSIKTECKFDSDRTLWETVVGKYAPNATVVFTNAGEDDALLETNCEELFCRYVVDIQDEDALAELIGEQTFNQVKVFLGDDTYCSDMSQDRIKQLGVLIVGDSLKDADAQFCADTIEDYTNNAVKINVWEEQEFNVKKIDAFG